MPSCSQSSEASASFTSTPSSFQCEAPGCIKTFGKINYYSNHWRAKHPRLQLPRQGVTRVCPKCNLLCTIENFIKGGCYECLDGKSVTSIRRKRFKKAKSILLDSDTDTIKKSPSTPRSRPGPDPIQSARKTVELQLQRMSNVNLDIRFLFLHG